MDMPKVTTKAEFDNHFTSSHLTSIAQHLKEYFDSPALVVNGDLAQQVDHQIICGNQLSVSVLSVEKCLNLLSKQDNHCQYYLLLIPINADNGLVISPTQSVKQSIESGGTFHILRIAKLCVEQELANLLGYSLTKPIEFTALLEHNSELSQFIRQTIAFIQMQTVNNKILKNKATLDTMAALVASSMLHNQAHNYQHEMNLDDEPKEPDYIQRVKHYIKQSWREPISLDDIMAVAQVSKRNLYQGFQQHLGMPPMHYLKNVRLDHVHQQIKTGKEASVTQVAVRCGFTHLGRFANEYKRRFGESPSVTMQVSVQRC